MKTINVTKKIEKFYDTSTNKYIGFAGTVKLYNKKVYVDTRTGIGYDKVIKELEKYVNYLAFKYNLSGLGFALEDTKQHIIMRILEGIPEYDPSKKTTLSTFLHMRIERRIINEVRNVCIDSKNPTVLKTSLYSVICECGHRFMASVGSRDEIKDIMCYSCNKAIKNAKIFSINTPPESLYTVFIGGKKVDEDKNIFIEDIISDDSFDIPLVFGEKPKLENQAALKHDIEKFMKHESPETKKLVELICFKDYTVKAAAEVVGISNTGACNKLRKLKKNKIIRDILGK